MNEWISAKERIPDDHGVFLFAQESGHVSICRFYCVPNHPNLGRFEYLHGERSGWKIEELTHWMPLPDAPVPTGLDPVVEVLNHE